MVFSLFFETNYILNQTAYIGTLKGVFIKEPDYLIFVDGSTYYAINGTTGVVDFVGMNKTVITQLAIDSLAEGTIYLKDFDISLGLIYKPKVVVISSYDGVLSFYGDFAQVGQPNVTQDQPAIRLYAVNPSSKPVIEWMDFKGNPIAYIVAHYEKNNETIHQHISIETVKADMQTVTTRFEVTYGTDRAIIRIVDADLEVHGKTTFYGALTVVYRSTTNTTYNLGGSDFFLAVNATYGNKIVNLPYSGGLNGRIYIIKKIDSTAHNVTLIPYGLGTIDGAAKFVLYRQYESVELISRGTGGWYIITS